MSNSYVSWILRYVPNALRGEFVNIGVLVGSDGGDWAVRFTDDFRRAKDLAGGTEPILGPTIKVLVRRVEETNQTSIRTMSIFGHPYEPLTVGHIRHLRDRWNNSLQLSAGNPAAGDSAEAIAAMLFKHYVPDAGRQTREQRTTRLRRRYREEIHAAITEFGHGRIEERAQAKVDQSTIRFDFALLDSGLTKLTDVFSVTRQDPEIVRKDAQSMGYVFMQLRRRGGLLVPQKSKKPLTIPSDVPISIIHDHPEDDDQYASLQLAKSIWDDVNVKALPRTDIGQDILDSVHLLATSAR